MLTDFVRPSWPVALITAAVLWMVFATGVQAGAAVAANDTPAGLDAVQANLTETEHEIVADLSDTGQSPSVRAVYATQKPVVGAAFDLAGLGLRVGHDHPNAGPALATTGMGILAGVMAALGLRAWRRRWSR